MLCGIQFSFQSVTDQCKVIQSGRETEMNQVPQQSNLTVLQQTCEWDS